jgi:hypothetical protein
VAVVAVSACGAPAMAKGGGYLNAKGVIASGAGSMSLPPRALVGAPQDHSVYVAQPTDDGTALARVDTSGNDPIHTEILSGSYSIPTVAIDRSTAGISADGSTLVLSQRLAGISQAVTRFEIRNGNSLRLKKTIALRGAYTFDAISPSGDRMYLIEYTSPRDPTQYLVRAYDVSSNHLLRKPVIDPDEAGEPMSGKPVTRATSPSGRWAYTLYRGSEEGPFVHALDTTGGKAVCVDLADLVPEADVRGASLSLSPDASQLTVAARNDEPLAVIDTRSLEASAPTAPDGSDGGGGSPWVLIAIAAALGLCAGAAVIAHRRRGRPGLAAPDA